MTQNDVATRLRALRSEMEKHHLDAWVLPSSDPHNSEYTPLRWKVRQFVSGFTASVSTMVVLKDAAYVWADGRYWLQAEQELAGTGIQIVYLGQPDVPPWNQWLAEKLPEGARLGFYGATMMVKAVADVEEQLKSKRISVHTEHDLTDAVWHDRPGFPMAPVFAHSLAYAGKSVLEKLNEVREDMRKTQAQAHVLNALDDIGYLLNLRGTDVPTSPYFHAYLVVTEKAASLYAHTQRFSDDILENLKEQGVELKPYDIFFDDLKVLSGLAVWVDPAQSNLLTFKQLQSFNCRLIEKRAPSVAMKAVKNSVEIDNWKNCFVRDGVAMVKFLNWFYKNVGSGKLTERIVSNQIDAERAKLELFRGLSFTTIPAYGPNAAMMHYGLKEGLDTPVRPEGFFLLDSGGQYDDGTTDITRTFVCGPCSDEQQRHFTLVLKGMLRLSAAIFMQGTRGLQLDILARQALWNEGVNYACGTGHGVGYFNNVHEGPHSIGVGFIDQAIVPGMVVTNEPGVYLSGRYGIRIENILLCKDHSATEHGKFYQFEAMTLCPIDTRVVQKDLLGVEETAYLNAYHAVVFQKLSPHLQGEDLVFLEEACRAI
jgi:Xaa-Pro aminopeptidase